MIKATLIGIIAPIAFISISCSPTGGAEAAQAVPAQEAEDSVHPISGLSIIEVVVESDAQRHAFKTELAQSAESQSRGLMFRTELADNEAMLFPSDTLEPRGFWMKNTPLSLDIIFIGTDNRILNIAANTVPYSTKSVFSDGPTAAVFEIRGGLAAKLGITEGNRVTWSIPDAK